MNTTADDEIGENENNEDALLDSLSASLKKLLNKGKSRGYITVDELNAALPPEKESSEQIEDVMTMISDMGINLVENEETDDDASDSAAEPEDDAFKADEVETSRTDDPVRMYLREMGAVELLSREGEIAIAKRIEAGRDLMIGGLCESALTIKALTGWHDALVSGKMLLRDIIDLDATYGSGDGSNDSEMPLTATFTSTIPETTAPDIEEKTKTPKNPTLRTTKKTPSTNRRKTKISTTTIPMTKKVTSATNPTTISSMTMKKNRPKTRTKTLPTRTKNPPPCLCSKWSSL